MSTRPAFQVNVPPAPQRSAGGTLSGLSADKALQFTPFTTSLLPVYDRIPIPEVSRVRENGRIANSSERKQTELLRKQLPLEAVREKLEHLLDPSVLTYFDFRLPPVRSGPKHGSANNVLTDQGLSPLARSILNMTKVPYRYPTPDEIEDARTPQIARQNGLPTPYQSKSPPPRADPTPPFHSLPKSTPKTPNEGPTIQIPAPPATCRREDYVTVQHSPKRRKVSHEEQLLQQSHTQKQQSEESLQSFRDFLNDIFEGQDLIDASGGNLLNAKSTAHFETFDDEAEAGLSLNLRTLDKLKDDLRKLHSLHRLADIPGDDLRRLQQICETSIERGQTINVGPATESTNEEDLSWRNRLSRANNSVCSAIVFAYTMIGNPQQEALISGDVLRWTANTLVNVLDGCIIPVVEARPEASDNARFQQASGAGEWIRALLSSCRRLLELMATACIEVKGGDACVNAIEFLAAKLIFVQNATSEKTSVLGLQVYENLRKSAMSSLSRLYARYPSERPAILDEVLTSLDKLPSTSRSARTFRAGDGKTIQLISALFMQLVQTTAMEVPRKNKRMRQARSRRRMAATSDDEDVADEQVQKSEDEDASDNANASNPLDRSVEQLFNTAAKSAQDIVSYLVTKASKTTKTGDSPYRGILDLLIEDLINVLESIEWPSAEILLRLLANRMLDIAKKEKAASTKNMGLESLGIMASAISRLRARLPNVVSAVTKGGDLGTDAINEIDRLSKLYTQHGVVPPQELVTLNGPFAIVANHFNGMNSKTNLHLQSARGYFVAHFAKFVSWTLHGSNSAETTSDMQDVVDAVLEMMNTSMADSQSIGHQVPRDVAESAYLLCILNTGFCLRLRDIVKMLSSSFSSDQAQVRSRSLKSIAAILENDSSLLDRDQSIADDVFKCASDESAMVRDSALSVIAKFIIPRKALEGKGIKRLLECAEDEKTGVQKRSIGHLKDICLQDQRPNVKVAIARTFLQRLNDHEDSIVSLAQQTLEDVWIRPTLVHVRADENSAVSNVAVDDLSTHLMRCVETAPTTYIPVTKKFFAALLRHDQKNRDNNQLLCSKIVQGLFEKIISTEKTQSPLLVLTALAEAEPKLIPPLQLEKLKTYLSDIKSGEDVFMFRSAVDIFCLVLPDLSESHKTLLHDIQNALMKAINTLKRRLELDAVMRCLKIIDGILRNSERLVRLTNSIFDKISSPGVPQDTLLKLLRIAGAIGKQIDLDKYAQLFSNLRPALRGKYISAHLATTLLPLTYRDQSFDVRSVAFESLGSVCQSSPSLFNNTRIKTTLFEVLERNCSSPDDGNFQLKAVVLRVFDEIYAARAASKEKSDRTANNKEQGLKQMGGDDKSREQDSAIAAMTPGILEVVRTISLSEASDNALLAARTLASISFQGLLHPQQCLGAFVAYGTSKNTTLAAIGQKAQHHQHEQHESHCEREYMSAIATAFKYQLEVDRDAAGAVQPGSRAKLGQCFDIITMSNSKYVKKFLSGLVSRTAIDTTNSENISISDDHVQFTRFVVQNVAFFEYKKLDELLHVILQLELAYSKSGGEVAQIIESAELQYPDLVVHTQTEANLKLGIDAMTIESKQSNPASVLELKRLGPAAACLILLIETRSHLLRQYGIDRDVRAAMANSKQAKDTNKAPTKVHGVTGERFWIRSNAVVAALDGDNSTVQLCKDFVAAMSVDDDFDMADDTTFNIEPTAESNLHTNHKSATPTGRKRKLSLSAASTPTKKRGRPRKVQRRSSSVSSHDDPDADLEV